MTYVPVPTEERKGHGRTPMEIPAALLAQLQHSRSTGAKCRLDFAPDDDPAELDELRRAAVRAGYRHFPDHRVAWEPDDLGVTFYVKPKAKRPPAKKAAPQKRARARGSK